MLIESKEYLLYIDSEGNWSQTPPVSSTGLPCPELYLQHHPTKPELSVLYFEHIMPTDPRMSAALEALIKAAPQLSHSSCRFDCNRRVTLSQLKEEMVSASRGLPDVLYHGTSHEQWLSIQQEGLLPRSLTGSDPMYASQHSGVSLTDRVYLCGAWAISAARFAAEAAALKHGSSPVVLSIDVRGLSVDLFRPDEDSQQTCAMSSFHRLGTLAYQGVIDPNCLQLAPQLSPAPLREYCAP
ncbi:hypothetical protein AB6D11_06380 [Vibrio splendidus]